MSGKPERTFAVKTPGAQSAEPDAAPDVDDLAADTDDVALPIAALPGTAPDLKAYIDEQVRAGVAAGIKTIRKAQEKPGAPAVELPDQSTVDAAKIKTVVLTKQGYVVPLNYGAPPPGATAQLMGR